MNQGKSEEDIRTDERKAIIAYFKHLLDNPKYYTDVGCSTIDQWLVRIMQEKHAPYRGKSR